MGRGRFAAAALSLLALAGCGDGEPELSNRQMADAIENLATARPEPEEKEPPPPQLAELTREEIVRALPVGGGCEFSLGGRLLFAAAAQGSLARIGGESVHALPNGPTGPTGGFWASERFAISVGRVADEGAAAETAAGWPARLVVTDRRRDRNNILRLEGSWRCAA